MQVKVPKFIDIEDKVVGPLTWRQFAYMGLSITFAFVSFARFRTAIALPLFILALGFGFAMSFVKPNGRPFSLFIYSIFQYNFNPRRYFWQKETQKTKGSAQKIATKAPTEVKTMTPEELRKITAALNARRKLHG